MYKDTVSGFPITSLSPSCTHAADRLPILFLSVPVNCIRRPSFRDGPVAEAVNTVVNASNLVHVMSAANDGLGLRFTSVSSLGTTPYHETSVAVNRTVQR